MTDTAKKQREKVVLAGYAYYSFVHTPQRDDEYGDKYKIDLMIENEDGSPFMYKNPVTGNMINMLEKCQELGLEIKETPSIPGKFVSIRSKAEFVNTQTKQVTLRGPIPTVYADKTPVPADTLIGNGSLVRVQGIKNEYIIRKQKGVTLWLDRVIVDKLVPYLSKTGDNEFDFPHLKGNKKASEKSRQEENLGDEDDLGF